MHIPTISFDKSIKIIEEIVSHFNDNKNVIINNNMKLDKIYGSYSNKPSVQDYKHLLRITTFEVVDELQSVQKLKVEHIEEQRYSDDIELHSDYELDEKKKKFSTTLYAHHTSIGCDISFPTFKYIDEISVWFMYDDYDGRTDDILIVEENEIMILDFSLYDT